MGSRLDIAQFRLTNEEGCQANSSTKLDEAKTKSKIIPSLEGIKKYQSGIDNRGRASHG